MTTAILTVSTVSATLPIGTTAGKYRFSISGPTTSAQDVDVVAATFPDLAIGLYSATCQRLDQDGNPFGPTASATFSVDAPALFDAPTGLTVVLS